MADVPVDRDQSIMLIGDPVQQRAVRQGSPAKVHDTSNIVTCDGRSQTLRDAIVDQHTQADGPGCRSLGVFSAMDQLAAWTTAPRASSRTATACSRVTLGKSTRKSSIGSPASR